MRSHEMSDAQKGWMRTVAEFEQLVKALEDHETGSKDAAQMRLLWIIQQDRYEVYAHVFKGLLAVFDTWQPEIDELMEWRRQCEDDDYLRDHMREENDDWHGERSDDEFDDEE